MLYNISNVPLNDLTILELSLLMLDHNYSYKKMIESIEPIGANSTIGNLNTFSYLMALK